ncbi:MAG: hypothetical protein K0Q73_4043 [Paenibacillus sp.]|jgi:hypothetical protein|nr:hypothetical protein [Paenibacillus sp.]
MVYHVIGVEDKVLDTDVKLLVSVLCTVILP